MTHGKPLPPLPEPAGLLHQPSGHAISGYSQKQLQDYARAYAADAQGAAVDACECGQCRRNAALARQGSPFIMDPLPERDESKPMGLNPDSRHVDAVDMSAASCRKPGQEPT